MYFFTSDKRLLLWGGLKTQVSQYIYKSELRFVKIIEGTCTYTAVC